MNLTTYVEKTSASRICGDCGSGPGWITVKLRTPGSAQMGSFKFGPNDSVLYYSVLYYSVLYYSVLYYSVLYYSVLYYSVLY